MRISSFVAVCALGVGVLGYTPPAGAQESEVPLVEGRAEASDPAPAEMAAAAPVESPPAAEPALAPAVQLQLRAAVEALAVGDFVAARAGLGAVAAALPAEHWLHPSLVGLGKVVDQMESQLALKCPELGRDDESIASLYTSATVFGFYTGVYLFGILGNLDAQAAVPLAVLTAGAGLGAAYLLDQREFLTGPVADGIASGMVIGASETALMVAAMSDNEPSEEVAFGLIWGGALLGGVIGGVVSDATGATRGDVALTTSAYTWGLVTGLLTAVIIEFDEFEPWMWTVAAGGAVGLGVGAALASRYDLSPARVLYVNLGGLGGALVGLGVAVGADMDDGQAVGLTLGLTYLGGLVLGAYLTRNLDDAEPGVAFQIQPAAIASLDPKLRPAPGLAASLTW